MRAVQILRHGGVGELEVREIAPPGLAAGEVLVRTIASSLNPVDWKTREWDRHMAFPMTLGWDLAGVVVGSRDPELAVGDRVVAMSKQLSSGRGTWADLVALPGHLVTAAPTAIGLVQAAALPLAGLTALQAVNSLHQSRGQRVLVVGAAGSVGGLAVQLALSHGLRVDGLVSQAAHVEAARWLGADVVSTEAGELPAGAYDAVLDTAGIDPAALLRPGGAYVSTSDEPLPPVPGATRHQISEDGTGLATLVRLVDRGELRVRVAQWYPVGQVRQAHRLFEAGGLVGKVLLLF